MIRGLLVWGVLGLLGVVLVQLGLVTASAIAVYFTSVVTAFTVMGAYLLLWQGVLPIDFLIDTLKLIALVLGSIFSFFFVFWVASILLGGSSVPISNKK
jgi:hypothetical protein